MDNQEETLNAVIVDGNGTKWRLRLTLWALAEICEKLNISLGQLTLMEVPLGPLLKSLHVLCADQLASEGVSVSDFYKRINLVPLPQITEAVKNAVVEAFPQAAGKLDGEASGPFDLGGSKTSTDLQQSPESTQEVEA